VIADPAHQLDRRAQLLRFVHQLRIRKTRHAAHLRHDRPHVAHRFDDVARAGLALGADERRTFGDAAAALRPDSRRRTRTAPERPLVDVVLLVGGSEHFALVDEVDLEGFEHLRFGEVADADFRHHWDRHRLLDLEHLGRRRHARHAAFLADVGGDALERHHRDCAGAFRDRCLFGVRDVHDHAAFEHLRQAGLDAQQLGSRPARRRGGRFTAAIRCGLEAADAAARGPAQLAVLVMICARHLRTPLRSDVRGHCGLRGHGLVTHQLVEMPAQDRDAGLDLVDRRAADAHAESNRIRVRW
jgi:hypothetical protein